MAEVCQGEKRTAEAIALLETALKIEQQALDPDHPNLALVMVTLADLYQKQGNYAQSELLFKQLVARDKKIGAATPSVALDLEHLASLAVSQGHKDEALAFKKQSAEITSKIPGFTRQNAKSHDTTIDIVLTGIPMQWLTVGLKDLIHCERVIMILDVCHGGAAAPEPEKGLWLANSSCTRARTWPEE